MTPDNASLALLRAAAEGQLARRSIFSNSGPGSTRWFVDGTAADGHQEAVLVGLYRAGLLAEAPGGKVTVSARGRARLLLDERP